MTCVTSLLPTAATAAGAFAVTNVDDLIVLTALFATSGRGGPGHRNIALGQYAGIAVLLLASIAAAAVLLAVPDRWIGLLGLVPIGLGIRGLVEARERGQDEARVAAPVRGVVGVAFVTVANGADNLSIYIPVLRHDLSAGTIAAYITVFAVMVGVWLLTARLVAGHRHVQHLLDSTGHWLVPVVFIVIGLLVITTSGLLGG
jgi:cadmium resistance protein CadD (predicted permease)